MAFNGSGTFVRSHNWVTDKTNVVPVTASRMDTECDGYATGLSTALCKDGQQTATARIPFALGVSSMDGSVSSASYAHVSDLNTGLYFPAADQWGLTAGGVGTLTSTATAVSLGSGVTLTLSGALTTSSGGIIVTGNSTVTGNLDVSATFTVGTTNFTVNGVNGNTTILGALAVSGTGGIIVDNGSAATPSVRQSGGGADCGMYFTADDSIGFAAAGVNRATLTSASFTHTAAITATTALSGATAAGNMIASQAEQETGTATDKLVTPGRQHFHPGAAKAWGAFAGATGTSTVTYNCSTARDSAGDYTVTIGNDFSSANYVIILTYLSATTSHHMRVQTQAAGSFTIKATDTSNIDSDPTTIMFACYGDL